MTKRGPKSASADALRRFRDANAALRAGRPEVAAKAYRRLLKEHPSQPEAHNNLGIALKTLGKLDAAAESYRRALSLAPNYAAAHGNLAGLLAGQGRVEASLPHYCAAMRLEPANAAHRQGFALALRPIRFTEAAQELRAAVDACLADPGIEQQPLVPALLSLLRLDPPIRQALEIARQADDEAFVTWLIGPEAAGLRDHRLLRRFALPNRAARPRFRGVADSHPPALPDGLSPGRRHGART